MPRDWTLWAFFCRAFELCTFTDERKTGLTDPSVSPVPDAKADDPLKAFRLITSLYPREPCVIGRMAHCLLLPTRARTCVLAGQADER